MSKAVKKSGVALVAQIAVIADREYFIGRSAAALACAVTAARGGYLPEVKRRLAEVERLHVERTIKTRDANEGLNAFIAKRPPKWEHR